MEKAINFLKNPKILILALTSFAVLLVLLPRSGKFTYNYKKGSPWTYETLVAPFDFPILKTQQQLEKEKAAAAEKIAPYFMFSEDALKLALRTADKADMSEYPALKQSIKNSLKAIYEKGIIADSDIAGKKSDDVVYLQKGKRAEKRPATEFYTIDSAKEKLLSDLASVVPDPDYILDAFGIYSVVFPNVIFDQETTDIIHAQDIANISPTGGYVIAGQTIVSRGEIVNADIQQQLDSYKFEYEQNLGYSGSTARIWAGNALVAIALVIILMASVFFIEPSVYKKINQLAYLLFIFLAAAAAALLVGRANAEMLYIVPFSLVTLFLLAFFPKKMVFVVTAVSLLPLMIYSQNGIELYIIFLFSTVVTMHVFEIFGKGWLQFVTAMIAFLAAAAVFFSFRLISDAPLFAQWKSLLYLFLGSLLSVAGYPLVFLFEKIFILVSKSKLIELADTNNKLLLELSQKAPGTFQHCLQVMNLCDAAARSIGANVALVRAGALYHDIGKTCNPQCFVENQSIRTDYHSKLSPKESARDILRHVDDGMTLAEKDGLPDVIKDFIRSHHGTSRAEYFYTKFVNEGGDPSDTASFTYNGIKPQTKEQVILMLCDTLEAASRTLKDNDQATFNAFVEGIIDGKIKSGQLEEADISLKEIAVLKSVLKEYLHQMYHGRIAYPARKK